jgi:hypothetical protein
MTTAHHLQHTERNSSACSCPWFTAEDAFCALPLTVCLHAALQQAPWDRPRLEVELTYHVRNLGGRSPFAQDFAKICRGEQTIDALVAYEG